TSYLLLSVSQSTANRQRRTFHNSMDTVKEVRHAETLKACFGQLDQGFGTITDQREDRRAQGVEPLVHYGFPGGISALCCHFCHQEISAGQVHEDEQHGLQESFIHSVN